MRIEIADELGPDYAEQWVELKTKVRTGGEILDARSAYRNSPEEGVAFIIASRIDSWWREVPPTPETLRTLDAPVFILLEERVFEEIARTERGSADTKDFSSNSSKASEEETPIQKSLTS